MLHATKHLYEIQPLGCHWLPDPPMPPRAFQVKFPDKLEQMDIDTLNEFGKWLEAEGLQAIATRVSTGDECSVIISDGYVQEPSAGTKNTTPWKAGQF